MVRRFTFSFAQVKATIWPPSTLVVVGGLNLVLENKPNGNLVLWGSPIVPNQCWHGWENQGLKVGLIGRGCRIFTRGGKFPNNAIRCAFYEINLSKTRPHIHELDDVLKEDSTRSVQEIQKSLNMAILIVMFFCQEMSKIDGLAIDNRFQSLVKYFCLL